ncbi:nuclear pore glycoprotein p62 isoform X2 [Engystomops pustulosus]|uniref:nuclear pore glycoprotein p62 isoform X2 n=1 Tax=Engystomops pustulosus TaxID=76066 RepID=UPI003AFAF96E
MSGFNFGAGAPTGGFSFGAPKTTGSTGATGFSFGGGVAAAPAAAAAAAAAVPTAAPSTGFSFGTPAQAPASSASQSNQPSGLFTFAPAASAAPTSGFSFGAQPTTTTSAGGLMLGNTGPKLGLVGVTQPVAGSGISGATQNPGFSFGATTAQPSLATSNSGGGFVFGGAVTSTIPPTTATVTATTPAASNAVQTPAFSMGPSLTLNISTTATAPVQPTSVQQSSSLFGKPSEPTQVLGSTTSSAPSTLGLVSSLTTSATSLFSLTTTTSTSATLASKPQTTGAALSIPTVPAPVSAPAVMTYAQLENLINKWSLELEDQEKHFLQQATQVNAWDRTLINNGERITALHREMEKVKLDQKRLDQELDFILSQQKELEDLLTPLEESVKEQSGTIYLQHADEEREKTYKLAENIDAQLKRMAQDLKDVIEHLNTTAGPADASNPVSELLSLFNVKEFLGPLAKRIPHRGR